MRNPLTQFKNKTFREKVRAFFNLMYGDIPHINIIKTRKRFITLTGNPNAKKSYSLEIPAYNPNYTISLDNAGLYDILLLPALLDLYLNLMLSNIEVLRGKKTLMRPGVTTLYGEPIPMKGLARTGMLAFMAVATFLSLLIVVPLHLLLNGIGRPLVSAIVTIIPTALIFAPYHFISSKFSSSNKEPAQQVSSTALLAKKGLVPEKKSFLNKVIAKIKPNEKSVTKETPKPDNAASTENIARPKMA